MLKTRVLNQMRIGARIIKTGIAVAITMLVCQTLNLEPALFGAIAAVINIQPSVYLTFTMARDQVLANLLGVVVGTAFGYLLGSSALVMGTATIIVLALFKKLGLQNGMLMGVVAAIFILSAAPDQFAAQALSRSAIVFVGLAVAMAVNIALWMPRHDRRFIGKLRESNVEAGRYFLQAVRSFIELNDRGVPRPDAQREKVSGLVGEAAELLEHLKHERGLYFDRHFGRPGRDGWFRVTERFLEYNHALVRNADQIYELLPARLERRLKLGAPPFSAEFKVILDLLESDCATVERVNSKLRAVVCDGDKAVAPEKVSEAYWERLTGAIERWQSESAGSSLLPALIEVAVVAHELRWVSREGKQLLREALEA